MMRLVYILIFIFIACGCNSSIKKNRVTDNNRIGSETIEKFEGTINYIEKLQNKFEDIERFFPYQHLKEYDCSLFNDIENDSNNGLTKIDSINRLKVFGQYQNDHLNFKDCYWFSFEGQIHDFYPITILQYIGELERMLVMVLFDRQGNVINSFPVADYYAETGECHTSIFLNDSTLLQNKEWFDIEFDENTGENKVQVEYTIQHLIISESGKIKTKKIKTWRE